MGFKTGKSKGPISEINVTPLVDVMLVLLVIFMISAPLMFSGVKLNLPKSKKVNNLKLNKQQLILSVDIEKSLYIGDVKLEGADLIDITHKKMQELNTDTVYLRADYKVEYGFIAALIARLKSSGIEKIALVTQNKS